MQSTAATSENQRTSASVLGTRDARALMFGRESRCSSVVCQMQLPANPMMKRCVSGLMIRAITSSVTIRLDCVPRQTAPAQPSLFVNFIFISVAKAILTLEAFWPISCVAVALEWACAVELTTITPPLNPGLKFRASQRVRDKALVGVLHEVDKSHLVVVS